MRVPIGCFVLMSVSFRAAQTSQELRSKYDEPDIERFTARPGIGLTVEFGSDGVACQELLELLKPLHHREDRLHRRTRLLRSSKRSRRRRAEQGNGKSITMSGCTNLRSLNMKTYRSRAQLTTVFLRLGTGMYEPPLALNVTPVEFSQNRPPPDWRSPLPVNNLTQESNRSM